MFANIIVDITHEKLDKIFQYKVPSRLEGELCVGMEVSVPFGRGNRRTKGYVIGFCETCDYDLSKVKEVGDISRKGIAIEGKLVALAAWMKEHYGGTMIQALKTVLPIKRKEREKVRKKISLLLSEEEGREKLSFYLGKNQRARARLLAALLDDKLLDYELVNKKLNIPLSVVRALEEQGVLALESERVFRNPVHLQVEGHGQGETAQGGNPEGTARDRNLEETAQGENQGGAAWGGQKRDSFQFTEEQSIAIETFWQDYGEGRYGTYLLHGVTGSGKTEVYIEMIRRVVEGGRQAVVLIPEIALTFQTVMRFYRCFGERVSIMHSRLSAGERYDQMMRAKEGEIDVMIGPRSALFTPFPSLGLVVIDEEHENTYKSEQVPRYHARETAIARAQMERASVVLGSATPSLEAMYRARRGEYRLLELRQRSMRQKMAEVHVVDLREELKNGNRSILSGELVELMENCLQKREQIMLFLNRRGYAGFVSCRECGHVIKCPHCDVSLSSHKGGKLVCHYCGHEETRPAACPECGSKHVGEFRAGTQQIEEIVKARFPSARVLRMDMDTTREKDGHEKILAAFANEEADVLVGTQMIVKGHDFPNVTLVGILAADMSLYGDDYRCGERTFQLLTQAAGRAGRGGKPGEAVIQTYSPEHYAIETAARQDYAAFYEEEIRYRTLMGYPPVENLLAVLISCGDEALLSKGCHFLKEYALRICKKKGGSDAKVEVIGPASPGIGKINDIFRKVLYLKSEKYGTLVVVKNWLEQYIELNPGFGKMRIQFDFNPMNVS